MGGSSARQADVESAGQHRPDPADGEPDVASPAAATGPEQAQAASWIHRCLMLLAVAALFARVDPSWQLLSRHDVTAVVFGVMLLVLTAVLVVALAARTRRALIRADVLLLACGIVSVVPLFVAVFNGTTPQDHDESILAGLAADAVAHGHDPYAVVWQQATDASQTMLMNGRAADSWGYPALQPLLAGGLKHLVPGVPPTFLLCLIALAVTTVVLFVLLPTELRSLSIISVVALSPTVMQALQGYPITVGLPFLLFAVWRWADTGAGGRLGRRGVLQALAMGVALSSQQLVWFVALFLLVGMWRLRRGELERLPALAVVVRYAALAAAVFAVVNVPFAVHAPHRWLAGVTLTLRQRAFFHGPGLGDLSLRIVHGSGNLAPYSWAGAAFLALLLLLSALRPRELGPAALVLAPAAIWMSMRAQPIYFSVFVPAVVLALATVPRSRFEAARPLSLPRPLAVGLPALGGVAVLASIVVAVVSPAPLQVRITDQQHSASAVTGFDVALRNTSDQTISPHFLITRGSGWGRFWEIRRGPKRLRPGQSAQYRLTAPLLNTTLVDRYARLCVVSDNPLTLSSTSVPAIPGFNPGGKGARPSPPDRKRRH